MLSNLLLLSHMCRDMLKNMHFQLLRYTKYYHRMQAQEFVMDLLNDQANFQLQVGGIEEMSAILAISSGYQPCNSTAASHESCEGPTQGGRLGEGPGACCQSRGGGGAMHIDTVGSCISGFSFINLNMTLHGNAIRSRMDIFDKILKDADPPIVRASGDLIKCMDDQREGFTVGGGQKRKRDLGSAAMQQLLWLQIGK